MTPEAVSNLQSKIAEGNAHVNGEKGKKRGRPAGEKVSAAKQAAQAVKASIAVAGTSGGGKGPKEPKAKKAAPKPKAERKPKAKATRKPKAKAGAKASIRFIRSQS